jgi:hypothetical protein
MATILAVSELDGAPDNHENYLRGVSTCFEGLGFLLIIISTMFFNAHTERQILNDDMMTAQIIAYVRIIRRPSLTVRMITQRMTVKARYTMELKYVSKICLMTSGRSSIFFIFLLSV